TVMEPDVLVLPAASLAIAVRIWLPLAAAVVSQFVEYGADVSSEPRLLPSSLNWTPVTPVSSDALAETVTLEPETVTLFDGAVNDTVGAVVSEGGSVAEPGVHHQTPVGQR